MITVQVACDFLEVMAVFLLAVEAIKISNLSNFKNKAILPLSFAINPRLTIVDKLPANSTFTEKHHINIVFIVLYIIGFGCIIFATHFFGYSLLSLNPSSVLSWAALIFGLCYLPFLAGYLVYQAGVWLLSGSVTFLSWIESHTQNGVVGIVGFIFYLVQFISRRVFSP